MTIALSLFVFFFISLFWCLGKATLRDCGFSCLHSLTFFDVENLLFP